MSRPALTRTTDSPRSVWNMLGLDTDTNREVVDSRLARLAEVAAIWPFVLFAQLLAPVVVAAVDVVAVGSDRKQLVPHSLLITFFQRMVQNILTDM